MEVVDNSGRNALIEAAANNDCDIIDALLARKAALNHQDKLGKSALIEACAEGHSQVVFKLLATAPPLHDDMNNMSPSTKSDPYLDDETRLDLDLQDWNGRTALICACEEGHSDIALALIRAGAALNLSSKASQDLSEKCFGRSALIEACERGLGSVVEQLIEAKAELNLGDSRGRTALISACVWGHDDIAKGA